MKNFFAFFLFLFISTISFSQKQGLGLLPTQGILNISRTVGEGSQILNTICVNRNLSAPNRGSIYRHVTGSDNVHFKVNGKDYPGGFQKAVEDEILILETQGIESVKVSINPNKPDIKSIEIGVSKGGTVLSESHALAVENHFEEISNAFPEALQGQGFYWELSSRIENLKKTGYLKNPIRSKTDLENAEKLFKNDFGNQTPSQVIGKFERIESFNKSTENNYPAFYINKSETSGQYILFNKFDKPIFKSSDELELGKAIEAMLNEHDNAFLSLNGFETLEKEASFISTLNSSNKTQGKNIYFNKVDMENVSNNGILFSKGFKHKLFKDVDKSAITLTDYNGQQYFKSDIFIESKYPYGWYDNEMAHFEALAKDKEVLQSLLNDVSSVFKSFTENLSLGLYFNGFKKHLKKNGFITSEKDFIILLKSETRDLRIVKIGRSNELYFSEN